MMDKKAMSIALKEVVQITLVVIIIMGPGRAIANGVWNFLTTENPEDVDSIRSFERLNEEIKNLLNDPGAYAYEDDIPISLSEKHMIIAFDSDQDSIYIYFVHQHRLVGFAIDNLHLDLTADHNKYLRNLFPRPRSCIDSCICLIKTQDGRGDGANSNVLTERYDLNNANCVNYDSNIRFFSLSDYYFYNDRVKSWSKAGGNPMTRAYTLNFYPEDSTKFSQASSVLASLTASSSLFYSYSRLQLLSFIDSYVLTNMMLSGRMPYSGRTFELGSRSFGLSHWDYYDFKSQNIYMDKIDFSKIQNLENEEIYILITLDPIIIRGNQWRHHFSEYLNSIGMLDTVRDLSGSEQIILNNIIVDFRKFALDHLRHRDAGDSSFDIIRGHSRSPEQGLYYFLDYMRWVYNDMIHDVDDSNLMDDLMLLLSKEAFENVKRNLDDRKDFCERHHSDNFVECFNFNCSINIENQGYCRNLSIIINSHDRFKPVNFQDKVIRWVAIKNDEDYDLTVLLNRMDDIDDFSEKYRLFLDYADSNQLESGRFIPRQLHDFRDALRLKELYESVETKIKQNRTIDIDGTNVNVYLFILDEISYVYVNHTNYWFVSGMGKSEAQDFFDEPGELTSFMITRSFSSFDSLPLSSRYILEQIKIMDFDAFEVRLISTDDEEMNDDELDDDEIDDIEEV